MKDLLPDDLAAERLSIDPSPDAPPVRQNARLDAVDESGRVLGSLSVTFTEAFSGPRGGIYRAGLDRSGYLRLVMKLGTANRGEVEVQSQYTADLLPADLLPPLRFLDAARRATGLRITIDGQTTSARIPDAAAHMASAENMIRLAEGAGADLAVRRDSVPGARAVEQRGRAERRLLRRAAAQPPRTVPDAGLLLSHTAGGGTSTAGAGAAAPCLDDRQAGQARTASRQRASAAGPITLDTQQLLVANPLELARQCKLATPPPIPEVQLVADQRTTTMFNIDGSACSAVTHGQKRTTLTCKCAGQRRRAQNLPSWSYDFNYRCLPPTRTELRVGIEL